MPGSAQYLSLTRSDEALRLVVRGDWLLANYQAIESEIHAATKSADAIRPAGSAPLDVAEVDLGGLTAVDTAGAAQLARIVGPSRLRELLGSQQQLPSERLAL